MKKSTPKYVPQKLKRNERERKRVDQVNQGFNRLRDRVPRQPGCKQKLSKVETLREAARYIQYLQTVLGDDVTSAFCAQTSQHLPPPTSSAPTSSSSHYHHPHSLNYSTSTSTSPYYDTPNYGLAPLQKHSPNSSFYSDSSYSSYDDVKYSGYMQ
ncbi:unnamed protein product [Caenorhabditis auriculariae]|uniref:BHLH domain-containing protein n=1 Tax=Caenorhabditis auriculariae TaxID=2777116 RepID=A0A8S1HHB3_9PELO|nr:unnamed protein product [Caenorhabditis auriculariae]